MVITSQLITITYQGILSPPGGIWQDDYHPKRNNQTNITKLVIIDYEDGVFIQNIVGTPVGFRVYYPFMIFLMSISLTFVLSYITIILLISTTYIYIILRVTLLSIFVCYFASFSVLILTEYWFRFSFLSIVLLYSFVRLYFTITWKTWGRLGCSLIPSWKKN